MTKLDEIIKKNTFDILDAINDDIDEYQDYVFHYIDKGKGRYSRTDRDLVEIKSILKDSKNDFMKISLNKDVQNKLVHLSNVLINDCNGNTSSGKTTNAESILLSIINDSSKLETYIHKIYKIN